MNTHTPPHTHTLTDETFMSVSPVLSSKLFEIAYLVRHCDFFFTSLLITPRQSWLPFQEWKFFDINFIPKQVISHSFIYKDWDEYRSTNAKWKIHWQGRHSKAKKETNVWLGRGWEEILGVIVKWIGSARGSGWISERGVSGGELRTEWESVCIDGGVEGRGTVCWGKAGWVNCGVGVWQAARLVSSRLVLSSRLIWPGNSCAENSWSESGCGRKAAWVNAWWVREKRDGMWVILSSVFFSGMLGSRSNHGEILTTSPHQRSPGLLG